MNEPDNVALVPRPPCALEKAEPGAKRILSGMVADTLALAKKTPSPRIVVMDDNPYPLEFMELVIKKWFKNVVLQIFRDRSEGLRELSRLNPDLLIMEIVNADRLDFKTLQSLAGRKVTYPIVVTSGLEEPRLTVNAYTNKGLNIIFLPKPFTEENIIEVLEARLKISRDAI